MKKIFLYLALLLSICFPSSLFATDSIISTEDSTHDKLKVGYLTTLGPMQYDDLKGNPAGITIDILNEISILTGLEFEFIPIIQNLTTAEEVNELDIIASVMKFNENSLEHFSQARKSVIYYTIPLILTGPHEFSADTEMTTGIFRYLNIDEEEIASLWPDADIFYVDSLEELEEILINGDVNFIFSTNLKSQLILNHDKNKQFQNYPISYEVPMQFHFSDSLSTLNENLINRAIQSLDIIQLNEIVLTNSYNYSLDDASLRKTALYNSADVLNTITMIVFGTTLLAFCIFLVYKKYINKITQQDKLTGFYTEYKFSMELAKRMHTAKPYEYALLSVDIDNFQNINEFYKYSVGNSVLLAFARYLKLNYRNHVFFSRLHSDHFLVLVKNNENIDLTKISSFNHTHLNRLLGNFYQIYSSTGIYIIANPALSVASMIHCANIARSSGKSTFGNTSILFTEKMEQRRQTYSKIVSSMETALKEREFQVYYQPKVGLKTNKTCGAEALIRWLPKDGSMIYPDEFIPLFEKNRYITKIDFYVFDEVCKFINENRNLLKDVVVSVNLSTVTLLLPDLHQLLLRIIHKYGIDVHQVELEITESAFVDNLETVIQQVNLLKSVGFIMALDDFGSGISSLNQLKNIDLDVIKLDKGFLSESLEKNKGVIVVENVVTLAKNLGLTIVAEGVETQADYQKLSDLECDIVQGYYFAKPMTAEQFKTFLIEETQKKQK